MLTRRVRLWSISLAGLLMLAGAIYWRGLESEAAVFTVECKAPLGWNSVSAAPPAVLVFREPRSRATIRCALQTIPPEYDATLDVTPAQIATDFIESTRRDMQGWQAESRGEFRQGTIQFALVKRYGPGKAVVTAFAVRGNQTLVVDLSLDGKDAALDIEAHATAFQSVLRGIRWVAARR